MTIHRTLSATARAAILTSCCTLVLVACGGAAHAVATTTVPAADPVPGTPRGEVEATRFADELQVALPKMTRLSTGIYYRDLEEGVGASALPGQEVFVTYIAYLADGTEVDRTAAAEGPLAFTLGAGAVIRGWDLGVRGMKSGGTRQIVVPSRYAYGSRATGTVPAKSVMVFVVRLVRVR